MESNDNKYLAWDFIEILTPMEVVQLAEDQLEYDKVVYLFTWNPRPNFYQYDKLGQNDYISQWIKMITVLKKLTRVSKCFCIIPEISDEGKLHCHGWFALTDRIKWLKSVKKEFQTNGFMKINKLHTPIERIDYYYKDIETTKEVLGDMFQILTHFTMEECLRKCKFYVLSKVKKTRRRKYMIERVLDNESETEEDLPLVLIVKEDAIQQKVREANLWEKENVFKEEISDK